MFKGFMANLFIKREGAPADFQYKKFGGLWYDEANDRAAIRLTGFPLGKVVFAAKPFENLALANPPYISGDIKIKTGTYEKDGQVKTEYQWIGHIQSQDDTGVIYNGAIEVVPVFVAAQRGGVFCSIFRNDEPAKPKPVEDNSYDDDDIPPF